MTGEKKLAHVRAEVGAALRDLSRLFNRGCRLTFVMRSPRLTDGDLVITDESDLRDVEGAIRRLREREEPPNVCEHGDHPAPEGQRFCSKACQECEGTDAPDDAECAGICDPVRQAYAAAAKHCHEEAAAIEEESALAAHVLRAAGKAISKMGGRTDG